uniref:FAM13A-like domain-containing protein n=1 Tax=Noctiluca scintillans TaxID=2966 RepID=A0A7S1A9T5_NOCSC|mmetsp:Transcript_37649/g.100145  ORF Transcript_37649/g.100145 Transcript_37649/m.100145 type:complete len:276 (+) Transcript_37649:86-913(+)|eukprot:CAMPEP_0194490170 /NCGR_PEP_ID=MMETSP0253-20130528/9475_1 /TAXON_ID=2966 /ORGANISM="Noctiluca scintillans" /LENGTH=275 /DNA_ID=CAMNT_0039330765 /DNA_START=81 /DNA_END=908 /DNA_ORIENTATION=-
MVAVEDVLTDSLSATIREWFDPNFDHAFLNLNTISVPEINKPIPRRWVDEVQIDEGCFRADEFDFEGNTAGNWNAEGRQRLREAVARLELTEEQMAHPTLERMTRQELATEKRRVKQELKRYDADFRRQFSRLPSHTEKEPMRPLYVYYRRLKGMITQAEQSRHRRSGGSGDESRFGQRESLATIPDLEDTPRARRAHNVEEQITGLEARLESLQNEKGHVRQTLQAFQERFVSENNRKIRFHKDILPIEREYRMYKNLKEEIAKVESQLRDLKN